MLPKCFFKNLFWFYTRPGKFTSTRKTKHFIGVFMTAVDRIKCRYAHSGMTSGVGGFQNPGVCLQAFPSFLPHPLPAYSRHFSRGPCSETARKRLLRRLGRAIQSAHIESQEMPRPSSADFLVSDTYCHRRAFKNFCPVYLPSRMIVLQVDKD